jgi:hypothetical protein
VDGQRMEQVADVSCSFHAERKSFLLTKTSK